MRITAPLSSGVVRWLKATKRSTAGCPIRIWSMSCGGIFASTCERIGLRHDQHDRLARRDHAADGVDRKLVHDAIDAAPGYRHA